MIFHDVTTWIKGLYAKQNIDVTPNSIRVKKCTHLVGAIQYASKELKENDKSKLISLKGWKQSWIDEQIKNRVLYIPHNVLKARGRRITQQVGAALVFEWCTAHNMKVVCKTDILTVVKMMAKEGYLFGCIKPVSLYVDVCALFGSGQATEDYFFNALHFL